MTNHHAPGCGAEPADNTLRSEELLTFCEVISPQMLHRLSAAAGNCSRASGETLTVHRDSSDCPDKDQRAPRNDK